MARTVRLMLQSVLVVGQGGPKGRGGDLLRQFARDVTYVGDVDEAVGLVAQAPPDLVIIPESASESLACAILGEIRALGVDVPVVVVSDSPSVDQAVKFVRLGAYDYVSGPLDPASLTRLVSGMNRELPLSKGEDRFFSPVCPPGVPMVGRSEGLCRAMETLRIVAESRCNPILILGETGTGKELAAQAVHVWRSGDAEKFVAVNCAALTANLLESELFGHVRGAFTGADRDKTGLFELAGDGTILLDEISEMPQDLQAKLLRALQEKTFRKVGGVKDIRCHATIVASSNRNLYEESRAGRFRQDLYYRLAVFPITLPPLRSRKDDIPLLAEYFVQTSSMNPGGVKGPGRDAMEALVRHDWPGNVRELRNVIERAMILERSDRITAGSLMIEGQPEMPQLPPVPAGVPVASGPSPVDLSLETAEREFILRALQETGWQRTRAAALLGITRATLHAKLKRYDIHPPHGCAVEESALPIGRF